MQPKCRLCGSRTWRLIGEIKSGKETKFFYQDSNSHVHMLDAKIEPTENPLMVIG